MRVKLADLDWVKRNFHKDDSVIKATLHVNDDFCLSLLRNTKPRLSDMWASVYSGVDTAEVALIRKRDNQLVYTKTNWFSSDVAGWVDDDMLNSIVNMVNNLNPDDVRTNLI